MTLLTDRLWFPDPAVPGDGDEPGLVAVGGDLSPERLLLAYRSGIFPWTDRPVTWWSPDPRGIIELDAFHVSRSLRTLLKKNPFDQTWNKAFQAVMNGVSGTIQGEYPKSWVKVTLLVVAILVVVIIAMSMGSR